MPGAVLRDSRHPCTQSTTFRLQTSKPSAEQSKMIQPSHSQTPAPPQNAITRSKIFATSAPFAVIHRPKPQSARRTDIIQYAAMLLLKHSVYTFILKKRSNLREKRQLQIQAPALLRRYDGFCIRQAWEPQHSAGYRKNRTVLHPMQAV